MENSLSLLQQTIYAQQPGFTPVRRRDQAPPADTPQCGTEPPWTTARCNRLLRPLSSRIALLRKNMARKYQQSEATGLAVLTGTSSLSTQHEDSIVDISEIFQPQRSKSDDPEWTPDFMPRKRLKRTYSSKDSSQRERKNGGRQLRATFPLHRQIIHFPVVNVQDSESCASSTAENNFRLDNVPKYLVPIDDEQASSMKEAQHRTHGIPKSTRESFRRLAKSISPDEWMLDDGLYSGLDALLKATAKSRPRSRLGARSLFATCLRKVPKYIAEEQHWVDEQDGDDDKDISTTIYGELEAFGSAQSVGWRPLREVVRAHGIALLGAAIKDHSIKPGTARGLIILCVQASAYDEAQSLIDSLLATQQPLAKPQTRLSSLFERSISLCTLRDISEKFEGRKFFFSRLDMILKHRILPIEWMASRDMMFCWPQIIRSIDKHDDDVKEAVGLFETAVVLSYQSTPSPVDCYIHKHRLWSRSRSLSSKPRNSKKVSNSKVDRKGQAFPIEEKIVLPKITATVTTLMSNMTAFICSITNQRFKYIKEHGSEICKSTREALLTVTFHAHQLELLNRSTSYFAHNAECMARVCVQLIGYVLVASWHAPEHEYTQFCMSFLDILSKIDENSKEAGILVSFLISAAYASDHGCERIRFNYLQNIAQTLLQIPHRVLCNQSTRQRLNALVLAAAFEFAELTMQQEHLDWALELEETFENSAIESSTPHSIKTPARMIKQPASLFRWEEGLCEWVARTPALPLTAKRDMSRNSEEPSKLGDEETLPDCDSETSSELSDTSPAPQITKQATGIDLTISVTGPNSTRSSTTDSHIHRTFEIRIPPVMKDECCTPNIEHTRTKPPTCKPPKYHENETNTESWSQETRLRKRPCLVDVTNCIQGFDQVAQTKAGKLRSWSLRESSERGLLGRSTRSLGHDGAGEISDDELAI